MLLENTFMFLLELNRITISNRNDKGKKKQSYSRINGGG